jgi:hypothetical protein
VGKPIAQLGDNKSRAAHERIASVLGNYLGLPVPPVTLWDRSGVASVEASACVVAWAFRPVYPLAVGVPHLTASERMHVGPVLSALVPFDFWVADTDRKSDHLLIGSPQGGRPAPIASIDYSNSMSFQWDRADHPNTGSPWFKTEWPKLGIVIDRLEMDQSIEKIENFDDQHIYDIVAEVPESFLPVTRRDIIIQNLISRKSRVRSMIGL